MKQTAKKYLSSAAMSALLGGMIFMTPAVLQAKPAAEIPGFLQIRTNSKSLTFLTNSDVRIRFQNE